MRRRMRSMVKDGRPEGTAGGQAARAVVVVPVTEAPLWPRLGSARLGSARLGSARLGSARLDSARLGSARLGSARLDSARLGSTRLGSARLGSARLGSTRLDSARLDSTRLDSTRLDSTRLDSTRLDSTRLDSTLMMLSPDLIAFVKPFFELFITFSPSVPFRAGNRASPDTSPEKRSIRTDHRPHRKTSFGPLGPGRSGALKRLVCLCLCLCRLGLSRRCPAVFSGALLAVFKSVWRQSSNQKYLWGFFDHSLVILLGTK